MCVIIAYISLVNTDRFPRGWRLSIGDYKRPLVKGLVNLGLADTTCSADLQIL